MNEHFAWEWLDAEGTPMYVGWGRTVRGVHPAQQLWGRRGKGRSELNTRLATFQNEPQRSAAVPELALSKEDARNYCSARKLELRKKSVKLLSGRPYSSRHGGGSALRVVDGDGNVHDSVRDAAVAHGLNPSTVSRFCRDPLSGWYIR